MAGSDPRTKITAFHCSCRLAAAATMPPFSMCKCSIPDRMQQTSQFIFSELNNNWAAPGGRPADPILQYASSSPTNATALHCSTGTGWARFLILRFRCFRVSLRSAGKFVLTASSMQACGC